MDSTQKELNRLIEGCLKGDRKSQQKVYETHYGKMMAVCLRYTKDSHQAKDILQDGFIKVFGNISSYSGNGSFEGWIRRIIVNTAIDYFRKNKPTSSLEEDASQLKELQEQPEVESEEEGANYLDLKAEDIIAAMQQLSPAYRMVFNLYVMENHSHKEIAEQLNISVGTSKSNLAKAKQNLKKILEKEYIQTNGQ